MLTIIGVIAGLVTVLTFLYMLIWGQKSIKEILDEHKKKRATSKNLLSSQQFIAPSVQLLIDPANTEIFDFDVFVSYSSTDEDWVVNTLLSFLEKAGLKVCIHFRDFPVGRPAIINMQDAAENSRHTILVMTPDWVSREWTLYKGILTRTNDPAGLQHRTIPLMLRKCDVPKFISMLTWIDFTRRDREAIAWAQLLRACEVEPAENLKAPIKSTEPKEKPVASYTPMQSIHSQKKKSICQIWKLKLLATEKTEKLKQQLLIV
jgi:hypothetical protein